MEIILLENVARLGKVGSIVNVRPGYGRNFLIPEGRAIRATKANLAQFEAERAVLEKRDAEQKMQAEQDAKKYEGLGVKIVRQASDDGRLFGSVGVRDVANALEEAGYEVDRRQLDLASTIKNLGRYKATLLLHAEVKVAITVDVVRSLEQVIVDEEEAAQTEDAALEAAEAVDTATATATEEASPEEAA